MTERGQTRSAACRGLGEGLRVGTPGLPCAPPCGDTCQALPLRLGEIKGWSGWRFRLGSLERIPLIGY